MGMVVGRFGGFGQAAELDRPAKARLGMAVCDRACAGGSLGSLRRRQWGWRWR
jgi:hypothetical protein